MKAKPSPACPRAVSGTLFSRFTVKGSGQNVFSELNEFSVMSNRKSEIVVILPGRLSAVCSPAKPRSYPSNPAAATDTLQTTGV